MALSPRPAPDEAVRPRPASKPVPRLLLGLSCLLLAALACALPSGQGRASYPPGGELKLDVSITDQFAHLERPDVQVLVRFPTMGEIAPADQARVTCNGRDVTPRTQGFSSHLGGPLPCTREPPGGAYHIVYSDEHSATTAADIPVPSGRLALESPTEGAVVPIPRGQSFVLRLAVPVPVAGGGVSLDAVRLTWCPPMGEQAYCGEMLAGVKTANQTPAAETAIASAVADGVTMSGGECAIRLDGVRAVAGRGGIWVSVAVDAPPQQSGFASAAATFRDSVDAAYTWATAD